MNIRHLFLKTVLMLAVTLAVHFSSYAVTDPGSAVGRVVALRGAVTAEKADGEARALAVKDPIFLQDVIETKAGRVQLMFTDDTLITLGSHSRMRIETYLYADGDKNSALVTEIKEGSFRVMGGAITRLAPDNFRTRTPSGTIGIRGSMYAGMVRNQQLSVIFQGGKGIYVANDLGRVEITRPGFGTVVKGSGQAPEKPQKMDERQILEIENALAADTGTDGDIADSGTNEQSGDEPVSGEISDETASDAEAEPDVAAAEDTEDVFDTDLADDSDLGSSEDSPTAPGTSPVADTVTDANQDTATDSVTQEVSLTEQKIIDMLLDLGFSADRSTAVPSIGLTTYSGNMVGTTPDMEPINEPIAIAVNWQNGRFMGKSDGSGTPTDPGAMVPGFAFGQVTSTGELLNVHVLGGGGDGPEEMEIFTLTGSETFGHIYGEDQGGLGLAIEGSDVNVRDQNQSYEWFNIIAAVFESETEAVGTGSETLTGFYFGIAEDMAAPDVDRRVFVNSDPNDFQITVNKDNGTLSGSMAGYDYNGSPWIISGMQIGGSASNSVWVSDDDMAAMLSGTIEDTDSGAQTGLKTYGNYLVGSKPISAYTRWGYWEAAYKEPGTDKDYHIHVPGAMWIAGNQTPAAVVGSLIDTGFTAKYTGNAEGVGFDTMGQEMPLTNGMTDIDINFDAAATLPVSGTVTFDEVTLNVAGSTAVNSNGFRAIVSNALTGEVNGAFFGPNAEGIGGNFSAEMSTGEKYHGVFAGDR